MALKKWERLQTKELYNNGYWSYKLDKFRIENGHEGDYHYVHTNGSSMSVPILNNGNIILINQFRYLNQKESLEFPCGSNEGGLSAEENAIKELREETGYSSKRLNFIGEFSPFTGASDELCSVFIAQELKKSPLPSDKTEEFEILEFNKTEIDELIKNHKIWDGMTIVAWTLAKHFL